MLTTNIRFFSKKILIFFGIILVFLLVNSIFGLTKARALQVQDYCGVRGNIHDFAGLVVDVDYVDAGGRLHDASDVQVHVAEKPFGSGTFGGNIVDYAGGGRDESGPRHRSYVFNQTGFEYTNNQPLFQPWNWGCPNNGYNSNNTPSQSGSTGVVLGYPGHGNGWVLDCDISRHPDYNQEFIVEAHNNVVPSGAKPGGFWRLELYGATKVAPPNGGTQWVTLRYYEPNYPVGRYTVGYSSGPTASGCETGSTTNNTIATIRGWAIDRRNPNTQIWVDIYIDSRAGNSNPTVFRVQANSPPPPPYNNVHETFGADYSNINHSFEFTVPQRFLDGNNHTIRVYPLDPQNNNNGFLPQGGNGDPSAYVLWNYQNGVETTFNSNSLQQLPSLPVFCPWLKTQNGNVLALSDLAVLTELRNSGEAVPNPLPSTYLSITDQHTWPGYNGARDQSSKANVVGLGNDKYIKEASYVIVARLGTNNFCSTTFYTLGNEYNNSSAIQNDFQAPCKSPTGGYDINQSMDSMAVFNNLSSIFPNISVSSCNINSSIATERYRKGTNIGTQGVSATLNGDLTEGPDCPTVRRLATGAISGGTDISGRVTLLRNNNLSIDQDIIYSTNTNYSSVNKVPNLAIVVNGDISIHPRVKRIDATLYATGKIKTCNVPGNTSYSYPSSRCGDPKLLGRVPDVTDGQLVAHGFWIGRKGFEWGRNFFEESGHDYAAIPNHPGNAAERIIGNGWIIAYPPPGFEDAFTPNFTNIFYFGGELNPRY